MHVRGLSFWVVGLVVVWAGEEPRAHAQAMLRCDSLPNPLYLQIGDTQEPMIKELGRKLRDSPGNPLTIIYLTSGSCTNIDVMFHHIKLTMNPKYMPSMAEDPSWTGSMPPRTCTIDPAGVDLDITNSNVFLEICTAEAVPSNIGVFYGPIQPYVFVVPEASSQTAITAEEAYFVFGFPDGGQAMPWIDEAFHMIRTNTKSTLLALAANINVPAEKWKGMRFDKSSEVVNAVTQSAAPEKTIGILGAEVYDANRSGMKSLAFRARGQKFAYFADSTASSMDKRNTRDGHYTAWSPTVYLAPVDGNGKPTNPQSTYVIDLIQSKTVAPAPGFEPIDILISKGLIPDCAMKVSRKREGGELSLYSPAEPCHCYFESRVGAPSARCKACMDDSPCGGDKCRRGFCEAVAP